MFDRGLELPRADASPLEILVRDEDETLIELLGRAGFRQEQLDATAWMDAIEAPDVTTLAEGYSLQRRANTGSPDHPYEWMTPEVEHRLSGTSLYPPDLDMTVIDEQGEGAAHALFWSDPSTRVGPIEPMGTAESHRGKGLARHLLAAGIRALIEAGSVRIKVSCHLDNEPAAAPCLGAGFQPTMTSSIWTPPEG